MMLPVFKEIFNQNLSKFGVILCINYEHYEIKPALYDVLGEWLDGSLIYRDIASGEITDDISRFTHFAEVDHVSDILGTNTIRGGSVFVLLENVKRGGIYIVDNGTTTRSLIRNHNSGQEITVLCIYEGVMGCVITEGEHNHYGRDSSVGKVDVFSTVSKKKYHIYDEISHDFTVFEFKDVADVV